MAQGVVLIRSQVVCRIGDVLDGFGHVAYVVKALLAHQYPVSLGAADHYGTEPGVIHDLMWGHGLRISSLNGYLAFEPSYSRDEFEYQFYSGTRWMFVAHP